MTELTAVQVLQRLDAPVRPRPGFADALLTSLLDELGAAPSAKIAGTPARLPLRERLRPPSPRAPRSGWPRWARVTVAAAAAFLVVVLELVVLQPRFGQPDALAVIRDAQRSFRNVPAFQATVVKRIPGPHLRDDLPELQAPVPDMRIEREISYLDITHFRNVATDVTWDVKGAEDILAQDWTLPGEWAAADGEFFARYAPAGGTLYVEPIGEPRELAFWAAGELMPKIEYFADPGDEYLNEHCEVLPDETMLGRTVHRVRCTDADSREYDGGPTLDLDTWIDAETGMLFRMESRNEGLLFAVTSLDFDAAFGEGDFDLRIPEDAAIQWLADGTPPERFRTDIDASVTSIPVGNVPERIAYGAGSIWVVYTEGGTGGDGEGGRQAVARIDPMTNEVVARIVAPTELTEIPKGWISPLVFVQQVLPTDDAVYIAYNDAGNGGPPVHIAAIDTETDQLGSPILTLDRAGGGLYGAPMAFIDGSLWVCDTQGGQTLEVDSEHRWRLGAMLQVDPSSGEVLTTIPIDGNCGDMHVVDESLWFRGTKPVVDPEPDDPWMESYLFEVDTVSQAVASHPLPDFTGASTYGDGEFWIVDYDAKVVNRFDATTGQLGKPIETGAPSGIGEAAVAFGEGLVWETDSAKNTLLSIDPLTGKVLDRIDVGASPLFLTVAERSIWVSNYRDGTVSRVAI
jgi:hypothetical protein